MNYERIKKAGQILSSLQAHRLNDAFSPREYVRVTYTHQILKEHEKTFESVVSFLAGAYNPITPASFFRILKNEEPIQGKAFLMTFDDGLMSSYWAIKKILSKFNIKAIIFVPTQILELKGLEDMRRFTWQNLYFHQGEAPPSLIEEEYLMMGKEEFLDLQKDGHMIFPHTHSHKKLVEINDEKTVQEELIKPKKILQDLLQVEMNAFAFPVGTERVVSGFCFPYLQQEYQFCFTALAGKNTPQTDPYFIHRDCTNADYDLEHVKNMHRGVFDLYYQYKLVRLKQAFHF